MPLLPVAAGVYPTQIASELRQKARAAQSQHAAVALPQTYWVEHNSTHSGKL